jgi:hypothetical protein
MIPVLLTKCIGQVVLVNFISFFFFHLGTKYVLLLKEVQAPPLLDIWSVNISTFISRMNLKELLIRIGIVASQCP